MRSSECIVLGLLLLVSCSGKKRVMNEAALDVRRVDAVSMQRDSMVWGTDIDEEELVEVEWWGDGRVENLVDSVDITEDVEVKHGGYRIRRTKGRRQKEKAVERSVDASSHVEGIRTQKKVEQEDQVVEPRGKRYRLVVVMILVVMTTILSVSMRERMRGFKRSFI